MATILPTLSRILRNTWKLIPNKMKYTQVLEDDETVFFPEKLNNDKPLKQVGYTFQQANPHTKKGIDVRNYC